MNILLVEDETRVADFVMRGLRAEGWIVAHAPDGETALDVLSNEPFDIVILDLMLPGISGQDVCRMMRARKNFTPVLMLTALDASDERVDGLNIGADDYITKPFDFDELIARALALHRRNNSYIQEPHKAVIELGAVHFDTTSLRVNISGRSINLTSKERDILKLFITNPDRVFSRERILSSVWTINEDPMTNVIDVYIGRLRKKLGECDVVIRTVRGIGYRMSLAQEELS